MLLLAVVMSQVSFSENSQPTIQKMNQMLLAFTQNNGQWDERVLFRTTAGGAAMRSLGVRPARRQGFPYPGL
jgi:hypothetical protein